jgi:hypothetical protein
VTQLLDYFTIVTERVNMHNFLWLSVYLLEAQRVLPEESNPEPTLRYRQARQAIPRPHLNFRRFKSARWKYGKGYEYIADWRVASWPNPILVSYLNTGGHPYCVK